MASKSMASQQKQINQYLRKHKNKFKEQTVGTPVENKKVEIKSFGRQSTFSVHGKNNIAFRKHQPARRGKTNIDHLPDEVLYQIFAYFGAGELLAAARVCKRWYSLANDNLLWVKIFQKYIGVNKNPPVSDDIPVSYWKSQCIYKCVSDRNKEALRGLRKIHPYTGLPRDTKKIVEQCGIKFVLVLRDSSGKDHELPARDTFTFSMSSLIRCYNLESLPVNEIRQIQVFSVNPIFYEKGKTLDNSPYQRSLLLDVPIRWENWVKTNKPASSDDLINLFVIPPGFMIATWKGDGELAFISVCLHHHQLVQRCISGHRDSVFVPRPCKPVTDDVDTSYGLHDYSCTVEIHHQRQSLWSQQFRSLHCKQQQLFGGYVNLDLIRPGHMTDHSIISQKLTLPWKTDAFRGRLENVTIIDVTLLDERGKPFWCASSPVPIHTTGQGDGFSFDYTMEGSCKIKYVNPQGKVYMELNWNPEREQFFVTCLQVGVSLQTINDWFSTDYR